MEKGRAAHPILDRDQFGARSQDGKGVAPLTVMQYALLHHLAHLPPGKIATYEELANILRPFDKVPLSAAQVRWHAHQLRRIVSCAQAYDRRGARPWPRSVIETRRGVGLRLVWGIANARPTQRQRSRISK